NPIQSAPRPSGSGGSQLASASRPAALRSLTLADHSSVLLRRFEVFEGFGSLTEALETSPDGDRAWGTAGGLAGVAPHLCDPGDGLLDGRRWARVRFGALLVPPRPEHEGLDLV